MCYFQMSSCHLQLYNINNCSGHLGVKQINLGFFFKKKGDFQWLSNCIWQSNNSGLGVPKCPLTQKSELASSAWELWKAQNNAVKTCFFKLNKWHPVMQKTVFKLTHICPVTPLLSHSLTLPENLFISPTGLRMFCFLFIYKHIH